MTRKDLERMVQGLADGTLPRGEFSALQDELRESDKARAFFRESMEIEQLLGEAVGVQTVRNREDRALRRSGGSDRFGDLLAETR